MPVPLRGQPTEVPRGRPGSATSLRAANQRRVVDALLERGGTTQAEIARDTGLASATVSSIVRELAEAGLVTTVAGSGRRGTSVQLARGAGLVGALDFGHTHVAVALSDMAGRVLGESREAMPAQYGDTDGLHRVIGMLDRLLQQVEADRDDVRALGMGLPAPIADGLVTSSAIMPAWVGVNARELAEAELGIPVHLDNDATLGALGEHRRGAGRGHANVVYVKVSSGVGAGLVLNNQVFRGAAGTAGEVGHLTLDEQGPLCRCGSRGCLEAYAGTDPLLEMMSGQMSEAELRGGIDAVIRAAQGGNVAARRAFEDAGLHLGWGLAAVTNMLNPGVIAVGGDMSHAGDLLLEPARLGLRRHVLSGAASTPVVLAELGDRAPVVGALMLAIDATDLVTPTG